MKVLYSQLQKYLPNLTASSKEVTDAYTLTGFMLDKSLDVKYQGKDDKFLDLEVRQNRADAFGVKGLARELSTYFNIPIAFPDYEMPVSNSEYELPIEVKAESAVKRVMAVKLTNLTVKESPEWLKDYLALYDINSINNLVDLTNFVMLETGHPSHAFDIDLMHGDKLIWEINPEFKNFTTLSGEKVELVPETLVVSNGEKPFSLSIIGGKEAAINMNTKNIVLEIAVYDGGLIRRNSRQLKIITEASQRLEKYLDPESIPQAFSMLVSLILENCGGEVASNIYDNYLQPTPEVDIKVDLNKVQQVAGIEISYEESIQYLERLGFKILNQETNIVTVRRPIDRLDIEMEEDVFEEIIRMKGYNNIPKEKLSSVLVKDITPRTITLVNKIEEHLSARGFDEVRSWVLVDSISNKKANFKKWEEIEVTNSINEEVPFLRESISVSLLDKFNKYKKNNIPDIKIFENGKIFGKNNNEYFESNSLGILVEGNDINKLKTETESLLRTLGLKNLIYKIADNPPKTAHPKTCWNIYSNDTMVGIIYLSNTTLINECCITEVDVDKIIDLTNKNTSSATLEVTQKLVELDVNVELDKNENINEYIINKVNDNSNIWKWSIIDKFDQEGKNKYTIRVYYVNLSDPEAKELHESIF